MPTCGPGHFAVFPRRNHEPQLVPVGIRDCHVTKAQVIIWSFGHVYALLLKLPVPGVYIRDNDVDKPADLTFPRESRVYHTHSITNTRHNNRRISSNTRYPCYA